jgi:hypothetical protein
MLLFTIEARPADVVRAIVRADGLDDMAAFALATLAPDGSILNCFRHLFSLRKRRQPRLAFDALHQTRGEPFLVSKAHMPRPRKPGMSALSLYLYLLPF